MSYNATTKTVIKVRAASRLYFGKENSQLKFRYDQFHDTKLYIVAAWWLQEGIIFSWMCYDEFLYCICVTKYIVSACEKVNGFFFFRTSIMPIHFFFDWRSTIRPESQLDSATVNRIETDSIGHRPARWKRTHFSSSYFRLFLFRVMKDQHLSSILSFQ